MYIGDKEVASFNDGIALFVDGTQQKITQQQEKYIFTDEPQDYSQFRELVLSNVMPEIDKAMEWTDEKEVTLAIVNVFEQHNVSIAEVQTVIDRITSNRVTRYNDLMKERMGDEIEKFKTDMDFIKQVSQTVSDSHKRIICLAVWKALWTYIEGEPFEDARDNIRLSHIKPFI